MCESSDSQEKTSKNRRYVAFFDMLGFKSAVLRNPEESWGALCDLRDKMDKLVNSGIHVVSPTRNIEGRLQARIFSDAVVVFSLKDSIDDLISILVLTGHLFSENLVACVPLRGGIALGDFWFNLDLDLFCGPALVRAYQIGEGAQWSGIVLDEPVAQEFHRNAVLIPQYESVHVIEWDLPIKPSGTRRAWVYNWPWVYREGFSDERRPPYKPEDYYEGFVNLFGEYGLQPDTVKAKYVNTVDFINQCLKDYSPEN